MEFKHTPAPWIIDKEHALADEGYHFILSGDGYHSEETNKGFNIASYMSKYDASLIAAAPELLESLMELVSAMERYEIDVGESAPVKHKEMMNKAKAAIAKALGEEFAWVWDWQRNPRTKRR